MQEAYPLLDSQDTFVYMHRDCHFGQQFSIMYEYYEQEGKGVHPDITLKQIEKLTTLEEKGDYNLAALVFSEEEILKILKVKDTYDKLKELSENPKRANPIPTLIADLILSEEEHPKEEIEALINMGEPVIPFLVDLIKSEDFYDPLFPSYGLAPQYAATILGEIASDKAVVPLFETIGKLNFNYEETTLSALHRIGKHSLKFLSKILKNRPITDDNEKAAIALAHFTDDEEVLDLFFEQIKDPLILKNPSIAVYLILALKDIKDPKRQTEFIKLAHDSTIPDILKPDFDLVLKCFR